jgi:DNA-binding response OmpR family regulator
MTRLAGEVPLSTAPKLQNRTILVVEDDTITSSALRMLFERRGWSVRVASTIRQAQLQLDPWPHWMIVDLMLPDGDGADLLREIRQRKMTTQTIVATGVQDPSRLRAVRDLEPSAILHKPVSFTHVLAVVGAE